MDKSFCTLICLIFTAGVAGLFAPEATAVQPQRWTHTTEADFEPGEVDGTIVTSLGDVKLATESKEVGEFPEEVSVIYDIHRLPNGVTYLAAGPEGKLLRRDGDGWVEVADLPDEQVFALDEFDGKLLVGISGETSRLALFQDGQLETLVGLKSVRYIWDLLTPPADAFAGPSIVAATGTEGKVLLITPGTPGAPNDEAKITELLDAKQSNILCLALDAQGRVCAGTDEDGLVFRLDPADDGGYQAFAMFDAPEPEIGAILIGSDGAVYVGTADAEQARPGRLEEATSEDEGRPDDTQPDEDADGEADDEDQPEPGDIPGEEPEPEPLPASTDHIDTKPEQATGSTEQANDTTHENEEAQASIDPTPQQYDRLRELIRDRLQKARSSGTIEAGPASSTTASRSRPVSAPAADKEGNAVYRIDRQGFVREVFRDSVMILKLAEADGKILAATGNEGQVFVIDPVTHENAVLVDLNAEQVPAMMMMMGDGSTALGTANPAQLFILGSTYGHRGVYTSPALDAAQISLFGLLNVTADIPPGCSLTVETRSGNVQDPEQAAWYGWSDAQVLMPDEHLPALAPKEIVVQSPPARFLQYRLTLTGSDNHSPIVDRVEAAYVTPNLKPLIAKVTAAYPEEAEPDTPPATAMTIQWEAADDNQDPLLYELHYLPAGSDKRLLIAEDLTEMTYEWQTRRVPDGRYVVSVTADDRPDNPGDMAMTATRRASPVLIDNSPPELTVDPAVTGRGIKVSGKATDAWSAIRALAYTLDSDDEYHAILPVDLIFDSTRESWEVTITGLSPGPHVLTLRAADSRGNTVYRSVLFEVK